MENANGANIDGKHSLSLVMFPADVNDITEACAKTIVIGITRLDKNSDLFDQPQG